MEYTFSEDQRRVAKEFARASLSDGARSKCYGSRGNDTRSEKLFSDFANGALAEMAGHAMLKLVFPGAKVSEPDFTVYKVNKKSFDADITLKFEDKDGNKKEQVNALVKSFFKSRDVDFAPSFCFQKVNGRRHADKELSHLKRGVATPPTFWSVRSSWIRTTIKATGQTPTQKKSETAASCTVRLPCRTSRIKVCGGIPTLRN